MRPTLHLMRYWGAMAVVTAALGFCFAKHANAQDGFNFVRGVVTLYERPIAGMEVLLTVDGSQVESTLTDGFGRFGFDGVAPGRYDLVARGVVHDIIRNGPPVSVLVQPPPAKPTRVRVLLQGP
jgi:hypothetical protein